MSDGPQRLDQFIVIHADAVVFNGKRFLVGIDGERDLERGVAAKKIGLGDRFIPQSFAGISGVGNQFA